MRGPHDLIVQFCSHLIRRGVTSTRGEMTLFQLLSTVETPLVLSSVPPADFCCFSLLPLYVCTKAKASHSATRAAGTASLLAWAIARNRSEHFFPASTVWLKRRWPSCADGRPWVQELLHHGQISNFQFQHRFGAQREPTSHEGEGFIQRISPTRRAFRVAFCSSLGSANFQNELRDGASPMLCARLRKHCLSAKYCVEN